VAEYLSSSFIIYDLRTGEVLGSL
jgi:hypothetical protein